jgi:hypothetical protein
LGLFLFFGGDFCIIWENFVLFGRLLYYLRSFLCCLGGIFVFFGGKNGGAIFEFFVFFFVFFRFFFVFFGGIFVFFGEKKSGGIFVFFGGIFVFSGLVFNMILKLRRKRISNASKRV